MINALNDDQRRAIARRLLHDTSLDAEDRLAGLLLLRYAQRLSAIGLLTTDQITTADDRVSISFGRTPIRLPHPVDELAWSGRYSDPMSGRRLTAQPGCTVGLRR